MDNCVGRADRAGRIVASGGGLGFVPVMPGTAASVVAAALGWLVVFLTGSWLALLPLIVVAGTLAVWLAGRAKELFGNDDPHEFVLDEFAGMWVAMLGIGGYFVPLTWWTVLAAFVLFRIFDIAKPMPVSLLHRLRSGWGVVGDDIVAGLFAAVVLRIGIAGLVLVIS